MKKLLPIILLIAFTPTVYAVNFGYETKGGTGATVDQFGPYKSVETSPAEGCTAVSMTAWFRNTQTTAKVRLAIYTGGTGNGMTVIATTTETSIPNLYDDWVTLPFETPVVLAPSTSYGLAMAGESTNANAMSIYYNTGTTNQGSNDTTAYADIFPSPWAYGSQNARRYSVYVTCSSSAIPSTAKIQGKTIKLSGKTFKLK